MLFCIGTSHCQGESCQGRGGGGRARQKVSAARGNRCHCHRHDHCHPHCHNHHHQVELDKTKEELATTTQKLDDKEKALLAAEMEVNTLNRLIVMIVMLRMQNSEKRRKLASGKC